MNKQKKILIVDDEPDILEFLSYNFRKAGFIVNVACDGIQGLETMEKNIPDLIIADLLMPEMTGVEMYLELRKRASLMDIPVLFLSAVQEEFKSVLTQFTIGEHYASKPIRFRHLLDMVNKIIETENERSILKTA